MIIAVDAVGGDFYPKNPVEGALLALAENHSLNIILVGPEQLIQKELKLHVYDSNRISIVDAPDIVTMKDPASAALNRARQARWCRLWMWRPSRRAGCSAARQMDERRRLGSRGDIAASPGGPMDFANTRSGSEGLRARTPSVTARSPFPECAQAHPRANPGRGQCERGEW